MLPHHRFYKLQSVTICMDKGQILKDYLEFKKLKVKSETKIKDIERDINRFLEFSDKPLEEFSEKDLINYLNSLKFKKRTINGIKAYLKNFIKWRFEDYSIRFRNLDNICKGETPTEEEKPYQPEQMLTKKDVEKLVKGEKDLLYKVFWLVFFYGAFRPITALSLTWDNILFEKKGIIIKAYSPKNKKTFYKTLPTEAEQYLIEWRKKNESNWLFPSPVNDGHLHVKSMYHKLRRLSVKVLGRRVNPYMLRHSIATILYNDDTKKDDDVANQLEHTKNMKDTYLNLDETKKKARARKMYLKVPKITKEEKDELVQLRKDFEKLREDNFKLIHNEIQKAVDMRVKEFVSLVPEEYLKGNLFADLKPKK